MCRTCGARPAGALRSSARRWLTPKRCCSSTTATARRSNSTGSSISACVPTSSFSSPLAQLAEQVGAAARGRRAGQQRGLHELARHQLLQRREVLLGERLGRRHQRRLGARLDRAQHRVERDDGLAGADLAHQQPLHRPVARRRPRRSPPSRVRWSPVGVNGSESRQPARGQRARRRRARPRGRPRGAARGGAAARSAAAGTRRRRAGGGRPPGRRSGRRRARPQRSGSRSSARMRAGSGSSTSRIVAPVLVHERGDLHRATAPRRPGRSPCPRPCDDLLAGLGVLVDAEAAPRPWYLPVSSSRVPGPVAALQPRLVEERDRHRAGLVGDARLDERLHAAPAHRAARDRAAPRRPPSRPRPSPARRSCRAARRSRGMCSSRSPTSCEPELLRRLLRLLARKRRAARSSRDGFG